MPEFEGNPGLGEPVEESNGLEGNSPSEVAVALAEGEGLLTAEEMEQAIPCDIIEVSEEDLAAIIAQDDPEAVAEGAPGTVSGGSPSAEVGDEETQATRGGYNYPPPFTRYEVFTPYTQYPYRTIGKLFFKRGSSRYVCSAASIGNNAIWTAGHCLHSGNNSSSGWSRDVVFVPAYRDGRAPFGQWRAKQLFVRTAWYRNGIPKGLCQDMGGAILYPLGGRKISQRVGWLGFAWNWGPYQHWCQFGYPAASPFNGQRLIANLSSYAYSGSVGCSPNPVGVGSDLTGGSSGGPWIWKFGTGNYVNGNNSYRMSNKPQEMFSPYFNDNAKSLYQTLIRL